MMREPYPGMLRPARRPRTEHSTRALGARTRRELEGPPLQVRRPPRRHGSGRQRDDARVVKPASFTYHRPQRREEVDELLAEFSDEAKILAGGQSLIPILNMRLSAPGHLIDINGLQDEPTEPGLDKDVITIGPLVRQFAAEQSSIVSERLRLLHETMRYVAHPAIRSRGTVVGSIAHADPAAELPAVFVLLQGQARVRSAEGQRDVSAADLYLGHLETSLGSSEWIDEVRLPSGPPGRGAAMEEFARRRGDYALCGVVAIADPGDAEHSARIVLSFLGMGATP